MENREYVFRFSASAVGYLLALLNERPRKESNDFYVAIEKAIKEQDEECKVGLPGIHKPNGGDYESRDHQ